MTKHTVTAEERSGTASPVPLLAATSITKAYAGVPALRGADLIIAPGEIHALMGENGAGKSTLIRILAGVVTPDSATITMSGQRVEIDSPQAAYHHGLRFIHQEFNVVPTLSIAENIFMGRDYPRRSGIFVDWQRLYKAAQWALGRLGIDHIDPRQPLGNLSPGDQMLVRISAALQDDARLYVMDEPTAALTRMESEHLFRVLREIRASGSSVLYVSHRIDEVLALCDRASVLRDGKSIDSGRLDNIAHDDLVAMMIGRTVSEAYPKPLAPPRNANAFITEELMAPGFGPLSITVQEGEIYGIAGLAGAGQSALIHTLFGNIAPISGHMVLGTDRYTPTGPANAWKRGMALVPRERRSQGLVMCRPIYENITLAHLQRQSLAGMWLTRGREKRFAATIGATTRLKARGPDQHVLELSGGNQQKVVFGRALSGNPRVLLLEEPTRGVDIGAKFDLYSILHELTAKGVAVIVVSSDLPELIGLCNRIAVMRQGHIVATVEAADISEASLINLCYGLSSPP